ncbi:hypothetical protein FOZ63_014547, partial [Perkinsus olseni]
MSRKYYERLVTSSGVTSKKFESNLGAKILGKFGWKNGEGLGAEGQGMIDCLQIKRREENEGLGSELEKKESSEWENWWADSYNAIAKKLAVSVATTSSGSEDSSDDSSEDEGGGGRTTAIKRADMQKGKLRWGYVEFMKFCDAGHGQADNATGACCVQEEREEG